MYVRSAERCCRQGAGKELHGTGAGGQAQRRHPWAPPAAAAQRARPGPPRRVRGQQQEDWLRRGVAAAPSSTVSGTNGSSSASLRSALRAMVANASSTLTSSCGGWKLGGAGVGRVSGGGGGHSSSSSGSTQRRRQQQRQVGMLSPPHASACRQPPRRTLAEVSKWGMPPLAPHHCLAFFSDTWRRRREGEAGGGGRAAQRTPSNRTTQPAEHERRLQHTPTAIRPCYTHTQSAHPPTSAATDLPRLAALHIHLVSQHHKGEGVGVRGAGLHPASVCGQVSAVKGVVRAPGEAAWQVGRHASAGTRMLCLQAPAHQPAHHSCCACRQLPPTGGHTLQAPPPGAPPSPPVSGTRPASSPGCQTTLRS